MVGGHGLTMIGQTMMKPDRYQVVKGLRLQARHPTDRAPGPLRAPQPDDRLPSEHSLCEHARERGIEGVVDLHKPELLAKVKDYHYAKLIESQQRFRPGTSSVLTELSEGCSPHRSGGRKVSPTASRRFIPVAWRI